LYGTTVNAEWLRYGDSRKLQAGDILVLSGLELFRYHPIEGGRGTTCGSLSLPTTAR
jgi:hypothetical protein